MSDNQMKNLVYQKFFKSQNYIWTVLHRCHPQNFFVVMIISNKVDTFSKI